MNRPEVDKLCRLIRRYQLRNKFQKAAIDFLKKACYKIERIFKIEGQDLYPVMITPDEVSEISSDQLPLKDFWDFPIPEDSTKIVIIEDRSGRVIKMLNPRIRTAYYSRQLQKPFLKLVIRPEECCVRLDLICDQVVSGHPVTNSGLKEDNNEKRF